MKFIPFARRDPSQPMQKLETRRPAAFGRLLAPDNPERQARITRVAEVLERGGEMPAGAYDISRVIFELVGAKKKMPWMQAAERIAGIPENLLTVERLARYLSSAAPSEARSIVELLLDGLAVRSYSQTEVSVLSHAHARASPAVREIIENALSEYGFTGYEPRFFWSAKADNFFAGLAATAFGLSIPWLTAEGTGPRLRAVAAITALCLIGYGILRLFQTIRAPLSYRLVSQESQDGSTELSPASTGPGVPGAFSE